MSHTDDLSSKLPGLPFTIRQLECLIAVAENGSISAAANAMHASDSAVSDSITAIEKALGTSLFNRQRSRGATLTSDGLAALPIAREIVISGFALTASVGREQSAIVGPVRVGITSTLASVIMPRLILQIQKTHPGIQIQYRVDDLTALTSAADESLLDVIITFDIDVHPEYQRRALYSTHAMLVVSADHRLAQQEQVNLSEIAEEPMVLLDITASRVHTLELMSSRGITPRIAYRTDDYELCRSFVGQGLGYTLLMHRDISPITWDGGQVTMISITPAPRPVEILAAWPKQQLPPRVLAVVDAAATIGADLSH